MAWVREIALKVKKEKKRKERRKYTERNKKKKVKKGEKRNDAMSRACLFFFFLFFCCERESSNLFDAKPRLSRRTRYKRPGRNSKTESRLLYSRLVEHQEFSAGYGTNACDTCHARLNFKPPSLRIQTRPGESQPSYFRDIYPHHLSLCSPTIRLSPLLLSRLLFPQPSTASSVKRQENL